MSDASLLLRGWISDYNAQGMESEYWLIFQDARFADSRDAGWRYEGMHQLAHGDQLTIFADDDTVLWSGELGKSRTSICARHDYPSNLRWHPRDVNFETWLSWFRKKPPFAASLILKHHT